MTAAPKYAAGTDVTAGRSREEIERVIERFGADSFVYGREGGRAVIGFTLAGWQYRFTLPLPDADEKRFWSSPTGRPRKPLAAQKEYEQEVKARWRALALIVKAKFAAVEAGISTVEQEFLANIVLPGGQTVGDMAPPAIASAYATGEVPAMFALPSAG